MATIAKFVRPGEVRAVVAESLLLKHQLLISRRARRKGAEPEFVLEPDASTRIGS